MRTPSRNPWLLLLGVAVLAGFPLAGRVEALTLNELLSDEKLNPKKFAGYFETFTFEFIDYVQPPEIFLRERNGDCDDYAILAEFVLKQRNFTPRLIHVRMVGRVAHAVCYVMESKAYLDYNNRRYSFPLERSGASIRDIATKVARSFESNWTSATEFTYDYKTETKFAVFTVVKTQPPDKDPDRGKH